MTATLTRPPADGAPPEEPARPKGRVSKDSGGPRDVRRTLLALLAGALGVFPLCALFTDRGWLIDAWLTMALVVAPAALLRLRRAPSAGQVWIGVVLLIPWLTLNFVRQHAVLGLLPLHGTWHDVGHLLTDLQSTTAHQVAPVHTTVAIRVAVCALLGLTAALIDLLAVVGRRGALAGVPLLIIYTIAGAVPRQPVSWYWFVLAAAGFLILLALDSSDDLQRWGHYIPRSRNAPRRRAAATFSGQRIAVIAILLALAVPLFVPSDSRNFVANLFHPHRDSTGDVAGFGADQNGTDGSGGIAPFAVLHGQLVHGKKIDLLTVRISPAAARERGGVEPYFLRTNVLATFNGDGWSAGIQTSGEQIGATPFLSAPGTSIPPSVAHFSADITISGLHSNPPVFGSPTALQGLDDSTEWNPNTMLLEGSTVERGEHIHEDVAQPQPTIAQLQAATASDRSMGSWLQLPHIASYVRDLTARITAGASTPYDKARAISRYFDDPANGFQYSLQTANGDSSDDLTNFLQKKVGYCQQYAAAMGVMLRLAGVPSRVVLGYAHDAPDASGKFTVTTFDAHAWVEAYFAGIGWVPFDPTPLAGISGGTSNDLAWAKHDPSGGESNPNELGAAKKANKSATSSKAPVTPIVAAGNHSTPMSMTPILVLIAVIVVVLALLTPALIRWRRRRHRVRQARHGDAEALWAELSDTATDLGYVWSDSRSPRQVAAWLGGRSDGSAAAPLRALTDAVERARYAPDVAPSRAAGIDLEQSLTAVRAELRSRRSSRERARAILWPPSLRWSRMRLLGRWLPGPGGPAHR